MSLASDLAEESLPQTGPRASCLLLFPLPLDIRYLIHPMVKGDDTQALPTGKVVRVLGMKPMTVLSFPREQELVCWWNTLQAEEASRRKKRA